MSRAEKIELLARLEAADEVRGHYRRCGLVSVATGRRYWHRTCRPQ